MYGWFSYDVRGYTHKTLSWVYQTQSHGNLFTFLRIGGYWLIHLNLYDLIRIFSHDLLTPHQSFGLGVDIYAYLFF